MSPPIEKTATSPFDAASFNAAPFDTALFNADSLFIESKFAESPFVATENACESRATSREKTPHVIQVRETVPDHLARLGSLDAWRNMARRRAFDAMLERVQSNALVRAQCHLSEAWEKRTPSGERNLIIVCDLNYWIDDAKVPENAPFS